MCMYVCMYECLYKYVYEYAYSHSGSKLTVTVIPCNRKPPNQNSGHGRMYSRPARAVLD